MEANQYRKKPVVIEAAQLTEEVAAAYLLERKPLPAGVEFGSASHKDGKIHNFYSYVETPEGRMNVSIGDWIITGVKGEHYPCKPDIFAATYEPAALSAAPAQEPVAYIDPMKFAALRRFTDRGGVLTTITPHRAFPDDVPLYASPLPQEVKALQPLTEEQCNQIADCAFAFFDVPPRERDEGLASYIIQLTTEALSAERELRGAQEVKAGEDADAGLTAAWKVLHDETIPASNRYIRAIKAHREACGSSLSEAKDAVDCLQSGRVRLRELREAQEGKAE